MPIPLDAALKRRTTLARDAKAPLDRGDHPEPMRGLLQQLGRTARAVARSLETVF